MESTMLKSAVFSFIVLTIFSHNLLAQKRPLDDLFNAEYEQHFISSGDNFAQLSLKKNNRHKFLVGLHCGYSPTELKSKLEWTDSIMNVEIELLKKNGYLQEIDNHFTPTISIILQNEGDNLYKLSDSLAKEITASIITTIPEIKSTYGLLTISALHPYDELSFFLLSDVLLDNWQINNVENEFLKSERPLRHGKRYYIQYAEKNPESEIEVFGIYGNQYMCLDGICYITYGNNRKNNYKKFKELENMTIPFLTKNDLEILDELAEMFKPRLIKILESNKDSFLTNYNESVYANEISFEEYFIWYYHFLYTSVTNKLNEGGYLTVPKNGIFRVKFEN